MVIIYTTCRDTKEAAKLGTLILKERLASCVNLWPIQSIYHGDKEGELKNELEAALFIKTMEPKIAEIEEFISKNHSYSVPYIGAIDIRRFNRPYREWMTTVVKQ
ncbi:MAG: divalent-cation tolerance protein CutA [Candidatus Brennerbacteria bacterium]|nr:divalent-cation tolerance protein CutA [Candidatus Brennerbacteria bacterium]